MGEIVLVRHGQTEWSRTGQHTGLTDLPLTETGQVQARALAGPLGRWAFTQVLTSPLRRAADTARLAGLDQAQIEPGLQEWDYGGYEGRTTPDIVEELGRPWTVFADGVPPGQGPEATPGESLEQVAARARQVLRRVAPALAGGDVALVAHGHLLRVLATQWLGVDPAFGAHLTLDAAGLSVLSTSHGAPTISLWNSPVGD